MTARLLLFLFLLSSCAARVLHRDNGVVTVPVSRYSQANNSSNQKRQDLATLPQASGEIYFIQVQIGAPLQSTYVQLDTGSNELWVDPNCAASADPNGCSTLGFYDPTKSSTTHNTGKPFQIGYGKGNVNGFYYIDTIVLAGATLPTTQFGVASTSSYVFAGIMGVCFGFPYNTVYNNVIDQLAADGKINSKLFSLALGSVTTSAGEIVFGGLDTMKYSGNLVQVPILFPGPDGSYRYWVTLNSVGNTQQGAVASKRYTAVGYSLAVILDSGTTFSLIPQSLFNAILGDFPGAVQQSDGSYTVPCSFATQSRTMDFSFGNAIINVPYSQFIWQPSPGVCYLGVSPLPASITIPILGDTFLRGAYVVYDQSHTSVYLANYINCGSNIVAVPAGAGAAGTFKGQCASPSTTTSSSSSASSSTTTSKPATTTSSIPATSSSTKPATTTSSTPATTSSSTKPATTTSSTPATTSSSTKPATTSSTPAPSSTSTTSPSTTKPPTTSSSQVPSTSKPSSSSSAPSTTSSSTSSSSQKPAISQSSSTTSVSPPQFPLPTVGCHEDNCVRALENQAYASSAYMYCQTFLATSVPAASTSGVPGYLVNCGPTSIVSAISSACPCFLATYKPAATSSAGPKPPTTTSSAKPASTTTTLPAKPALPTGGCHEDNCLRALENQAYARSAYSFCNTFLATTVAPTATTAIPNYLVNCGPSTTVSALSSACPCFLATYTPAPTA